MASPGLPRSIPMLQSLVYLMPLFTAFPHRSLAQSTINSAAQASLPTTTPTFDGSDISSFGNASPTAITLPTGYGGPSSPNPDDPGYVSSHDVVNSYFLLLVIFVAIIIIACCFVLRRRRRKVARLQGNRQVSLAQGLQAWTGGRRWVHTRWRSEPRVEGLDERGEAPPPYMPERPAETHAASGSRATEGPIPLQDIHKPPEYEEAATSSPTGQRTGPSVRDV